MKTKIIKMLTILCVLLPVLGLANRVMFEIAIILWPIIVILTLILKMKWKS